MSRWHQDPPDDNRYDEKPIDVQDMPEDDAPVDPAEHAAQEAHSALQALSQQIADASDFERVMSLWKLIRQIEVSAANLVNVVAARCDEITERRR